jgi:hypothetical protein
MSILVFESCNGAVIVFEMRHLRLM